MEEQVSAAGSTGEYAPEFACKLCGRNFSNETSLKIHEQYSHAPSTVSPAASRSHTPEGLPQHQPRHPPPPPQQQQQQHPPVSLLQDRCPAGAEWNERISNGTVNNSEEQYYPNYWPPPENASGHDAGHEVNNQWGEPHFPPTPDSSGFSGSHQSKSPNNEAAEILDLDSNRVQVYTTPIPPPAPQPVFYGQQPLQLTQYHATLPVQYSVPPQMIPAKSFTEQNFQYHYSPNPSMHVTVPHQDAYPGFMGGQAPPHGDMDMDKNPLAGSISQSRRTKTYHCDVCDKKFTSMGHLKRHYNTIVHKQTKEGKRTAAPNNMKPKQRTGREESFEAAGVQAPPPLVNMASSNVFGMNVFAGQGTPPPHYPMTPPLQEAAPALSASSMIAPPPQPLGYHHQGAPDFQVSLAPSPNPQSLPQGGATGFLPYSTASATYINSTFNGYPVSTMASGAAAMQQTAADASSINEEIRSPGSACGSHASSEDSSSEEAPLVCCGRRFASMAYYKQHLDSQHGGERQGRCGQCGRRHAADISCDEYDRQNRRHHQCDICDKLFSHYSDLKRHKYTHLAEKPFICPQCGRGFIRKDQMEKHMPSHDPLKPEVASAGVTWQPQLPFSVEATMLGNHGSHQEAAMISNHANHHDAAVLGNHGNHQEAAMLARRQEAVMLVNHGSHQDAAIIGNHGDHQEAEMRGNHGHHQDAAILGNHVDHQEAAHQGNHGHHQDAAIIGNHGDHQEAAHHGNHGHHQDAAILGGHGDQQEAAHHGNHGHHQEAVMLARRHEAISMAAMVNGGPAAHSLAHQHF